ncbi:hypothetical protein LTR28_003159, partial [Elasticomyces elasticus]
MKPNGTIPDFLRYYDRSVSLLRISLAKNQRCTVATLLTNLQLATFEEFLGDWINLLAHRTVAYEILTGLHTPQTIMQDGTRRKMLDWYIRSDLLATLQFGYGTVQGREWFAAAYDFYREQARAKPGDAPTEFEKMSALIRLLATNVASLFARKGSGRISDKAFIMDCDMLAERFVEADRIISKLAIDFSSTSPRESSDVADRYKSQLLHADGLFTINFILMDLWSIALVFKYRLLT